MFTRVASAAVLVLLSTAFATSQAQQPTQPVTAPPPCNQSEYASLKNQLQDWAGLHRYAQDNMSLAATPVPSNRVVFFGDSITDEWAHGKDTGPFFPGKPYVNRGIGGQTTPQMLVRFEPDVIHLHPAAVLILAGTNDIAGNTGPSTVQMIEDNYTAMTKLAAANGIRVILASITPADHYNWKPGVKPVAEIREVNDWMASFCAAGACTYLDYFSSMSDASGAMKSGYSKDGVHPTAEGYAVMAPLAEKAISQALGR